MYTLPRLDTDERKMALHKGSKRFRGFRSTGPGTEHDLGTGPGARFSKAPETFLARQDEVKFRTLRLQSCFIHVFLI